MLHAADRAAGGQLRGSNGGRIISAAARRGRKGPLLLQEEESRYSARPRPAARGEGGAARKERASSCGTRSFASSMHGVYADRMSDRLPRQLRTRRVCCCDELLQLSQQKQFCVRRGSSCCH